MTFDGKWMELENIMLSEISHTQKIKGQIFSLICGTKAKEKGGRGGYWIT